MFALNFTDRETKMLQSLGKSSFAEPLLELFERLKIEMSEIDGIQGDYAAQVEGRKLFKKLIKDVSDKIKVIERPKRKVEGNDDFSS